MRNYEIFLAQTLDRLRSIKVKDAAVRDDRNATSGAAQTTTRLAAQTPQKPAPDLDLVSVRLRLESYAKSLQSFTLPEIENAASFADRSPCSTKKGF
jgi:hypothetical protein